MFFIQWKAYGMFLPKVKHFCAILTFLKFGHNSICQDIPEILNKVHIILENSITFHLRVHTGLYVNLDGYSVQ